MEPKTATRERHTTETRISASLTNDQAGNLTGGTGVGFFDHMLQQLTRHSGLSLSLKVEGDLKVDAHHTVEDTGIVCGELLHELVGTAAGLRRFGSALIPMEETLVECALDLCGRGYLVYNIPINASKVGCFDAELAREFFLAFSRSGSFALHLNARYGINQHHLLEAAFKSTAQALRMALTPTGQNTVPSTKGVL